MEWQLASERSLLWSRQRRAHSRRQQQARARRRRRSLGFTLTSLLLVVLLLSRVLVAAGQAPTPAPTPSAKQPLATSSPSPPPGRQVQQLSPQGLALIAEFEGFFAAPYNDPVGYCTIGYGTLLHLSVCTSADQQRWGRISRAQGRALLAEEVEAKEAEVRRLVRVPLRQQQFDALVSLAYNIGTPALARSSLLRLLNQGQTAAAGEQFLRWTQAAGQTLPGLVRRRQAERRLFLG